MSNKLRTRQMAANQVLARLNASVAPAPGHVSADHVAEHVARRPSNLASVSNL